MYLVELNLDQEALDFAHMQINYFSNLPSHVKGTVQELKETRKPDLKSSPAHLIDDKTTIIKGKLNIPTITYKQEFKTETVHEIPNCPHPTFN